MFAGLFGEKGVGCFAVFGEGHVCAVCRGLFAFPLGVIDRLCSNIRALSRHLLF